MRTEKIKEIIGDYFYDFWRNATYEMLENGKKCLKQELETCELDPKTQYRHIAEYELICSYLGLNEIDLNFDRLKELREKYVKMYSKHEQ